MWRQWTQSTVCHARGSSAARQVPDAPTATTLDKGLQHTNPGLAAARANTSQQTTQRPPKYPQQAATDATASIQWHRAHTPRTAKPLHRYYATPAARGHAATPLHTYLQHALPKSRHYSTQTLMHCHYPYRLEGGETGATDGRHHTARRALEAGNHYPRRTVYRRTRDKAKKGSVSGAQENCKKRHKAITTGAANGHYEKPEG